MFRNLRLGSKIGLGFGLVLILLSVVLTMSIFALKKADNGISDYRALARDTNLAGRLQANMLMVRMNVKDFLITKSDSDLNQYQDYLSKMKGFLQQAVQEINNPERASHITEVRASIDTYEQSFNKVVDLIKKRDVVYSSVIVPQGEKMRDLIEEIIETAYQDEDTEAVYHAGHVQDKMLVGRLFVMKYLQSNTVEDYGIAIANMSDNLSKEIVDLNGNLQDSHRRDLLAQFNQAQKLYINGMKDINSLITQRNTLIEDSLNAIGPSVAANVEDVKLSIMTDQDTLGPQLKETTDRSIQITIILSVIAIILGVVAAYLLTVNITRPIRKAVEAANQLSHGDLTINVGATSKDETGQLLDAVQNTATNLKQMMSTISMASVELASASEELAVVTEQTSEGIIQQESETEMVATAMNQMATTVHDVADNAAHAAEAANQADTKSKTGSAVVQQTIESINSLSNSVIDSSNKLSEVQQEVLNISTILDVIRGIADQTNLLALNAAIEAARAGEQGRGFAVVADEVRSLAARTQGSTSEIQTLIEQLQVGTENTVEQMDLGKLQAENCVKNAVEASSALDSITNAINVINDMNMQIASASEEQSSVAESINENVVNVKRIAEENAVAANQTRGSSTEIAQLAEQLNGLVSQFRV
ncbi:methyl-accepting chemotaxis protein [Vibrio algarum]|uniref:Methyl-accepting chemotaxis protein n=1 Tax=Vibrio algarum TaxID=3020714 RepID=A0ABT4YQF1_9VIBR|nr:methyl-accepting chemotaxis protein [Vibrio sp. KJ40-1]MDB1123791.1 methyl-accepting chemotaxis protein [Vibrio sp. KJ40-1]